MAEVLKDVDIQKNGSKTTVKGGEALKGKLVALYFSAHWCPPCRQFTPVLKDFYEEVTGEGEDFEIVFVPFDRSAEDLAEYLAESHGDWYYLPFGSDGIQMLSDKYSVSGIPALIVIKADGTVVNKNARGDVSGKPPKVTFSQWKASAGSA